MKQSFSEWKVEDHLKTPEERAAYIDAAAEEGTPDAIPDAFADVFRALGKHNEATVCESLAAYLRSVGDSAAGTSRATARNRSVCGTSRR